MRNINWWEHCARCSLLWVSSDPDVMLSWMIRSHQYRGKCLLPPGHPERQPVCSGSANIRSLGSNQDFLEWFSVSGPGLRSRSGLYVGAVSKYQWHQRTRQQTLAACSRHHGGCSCKHPMISFAFLKASDSAFASWESGLKGHRDTNWSFELCLEGPSSRDSVFLLTLLLKLKEIPPWKCRQGGGRAAFSPKRCARTFLPSLS